MLSVLSYIIESEAACTTTKNRPLYYKFNDSFNRNCYSVFTGLRKMGDKPPPEVE